MRITNKDLEHLLLLKKKYPLSKSDQTFIDKFVDSYRNQKIKSKNRFKKAKAEASLYRKIYNDNQWEKAVNPNWKL